MIWDKPLHIDRSIENWLGDPDTGFSAKIIKLIERHEADARINPKEFTKDGKLVAFSSIDSILDICGILKALSPYVDYAMWLDARNITNKLRFKKWCDWLGTTWRAAYINSDVLIISDIPPDNDFDSQNFPDRKEISILIDLRQQRGSSLTILIGPNETSLPATKKYVAINKAIKEVANRHSPSGNSIFNKIN